MQVFLVSLSCIFEHTTQTSRAYISPSSRSTVAIQRFGGSELIHHFLQSAPSLRDELLRAKKLAGHTDTTCSTGFSNDLTVSDVGL